MGQLLRQWFSKHLLEEEKRGPNDLARAPRHRNTPNVTPLVLSDAKSDTDDVVAGTTTAEALMTNK